MDRIEELENLLERYKTFNDTKKNLLSKIINRLLNESFLMLDRNEDKDDYYNAFPQLPRLQFVLLLNFLRNTLHYYYCIYKTICQVLF